MLPPMALGRILVAQRFVWPNQMQQASIADRLKLQETLPTLCEIQLNPFFSYLQVRGRGGRHKVQPKKGNY